MSIPSRVQQHRDMLESLPTGPRTIQVTFPLPPNLGNGRFHWRTLARLKSRFYESMDNRQLLGAILRPPVRPLSPVILTATMYVAMPHDSDNAKLRCYKFPADWLRTRGYIVNDDPDHCRMTDPVQVVKRGQEYRVEITITEGFSEAASTE